MTPREERMFFVICASDKKLAMARITENRAAFDARYDELRKAFLVDEDNNGHRAPA